MKNQICVHLIIPLTAAWRSPNTGGNSKTGYSFIPLTDRHMKHMHDFPQTSLAQTLPTGDSKDFTGHVNLIADFLQNATANTNHTLPYPTPPSPIRNLSSPQI